MKILNFEYQLNQIIKEEKLKEINNFLLPEIIALQEASSLKYKTNYAAINLPEDQETVNQILSLVESILNLKPKLLIVIGIGGSNLGTLAVFEAIKGRFYNNLNPEIYFFSADTIDEDYTSSLLKITQEKLSKGENIILNIVTKSGTTTETIANAAIFIDLLKKYKKDYEKYVYVTTDLDSPLHDVARENNWVAFTIPNLVGGRYSVFSAVGLLPLAILGVDIKELLSGASFIKGFCLAEDYVNNPAALSASIIYLYYLADRNIHDLFVFLPDFYSLGLWCRQLMAESLGKKYSKLGNIIETGITPTVSVATQDLHSVFQLYVSGPQDKITTFLSIAHKSDTVIVPDNEISRIDSLIINKSITTIKNSILAAVIDSCDQGDRPFISITLKEKNSYYIGQFMMLKMFETLYLARLLDVNPFDQPGVELYKNKTKEFLSEEK